jgi:hypothetical protein
MSVNALGPGRAAGPSPAGGTGEARQAPPAPPPGPPPGERGFVNAIGSALESLGVGDVAAGDKDGAATALGGFLQQLMSALHEQGGSGAVAAGGPGRLAQDLQSLAASLQGAAPGGGASSPLESAFSSLLDSLGTDSGDANSKLRSFLQTLADKLPQAGGSGNLVNTTA